MAYTEAEIINLVSTALVDTSTAIWGTAEIGGILPECLDEISMYRPYVTLATATTSDGTKTVDISSHTDYFRIDEVEFRVDKDPPRFRNFKEISSGSILLDIDFSPNASENVRLYLAKAHILDGTTTNTMDPIEERLLVERAAAKLAMRKSVDHINTINLGGGGVHIDYEAWGKRMLEENDRKLYKYRRKKHSQVWPKDA